ncbi:MAG TPA: GntR family transcriptional regulator [Candidatus Methylomirabilis sp.]|nr:GntR family transcriptional regulator [Candidatus Methylomirabilis sp.]
MATTYRTMQGIVYDTIREAILNGRYAPGQRLMAEEMARELGTSRMPVREALHRLEVAGLVSITPHRGAIVSELSRDEIVEIYHIRAVLEGLAARLAAPYLVACDHDRLNAHIDVMASAATSGPDLERFLRGNREFHEVIWKGAHSPRLHELLENLYIASQRFRNVSLLLPGRLAEIVREHRRIAHAMAAGDPAAAERFAKTHYENTARRLLIEVKNIGKEGA